MRGLVLFLPSVFVGLTFAAPVPKDKPKVNDEEAILGTWTLTAFDAGGEKPPVELNTIQFIFAEKGKFTMNRGGTADPGEGTFKLDPTAKVKEVDIEQDGKKMFAIYELDGDTLKMCIPDKPNSPRPEKFVANAKDRVAVVTFTRVKEEKKDTQDK